MTTIRITGIHASGRHGASPGERDEAQEFVVDLEVDVDPDTDELAATADYRQIVGAARRVVEEESVELLETLAHRVADAIRPMDGVRRVHVVVHKPGAAKRMDVDDVSAEVVIE